MQQQVAVDSRHETEIAHVAGVAVATVEDLLTERNPLGGRCIAGHDLPRHRQRRDKGRQRVALSHRQI